MVPHDLDSQYSVSTRSELAYLVYVPGKVAAIVACGVLGMITIVTEIFVGPPETAYPPQRIA
jgi:hypothetical protein